MFTDPTPDHEWLMQLVGDWTWTSSCIMGPDQDPIEGSGTEHVRAIGKLWTVGESHSTLPDGSPMIGIMTLGYDPTRSRFMGNWIGSPMAHLFVYDGALDASRRVLTLNNSGPSFMEPGKITRYRDILEINSPTERVLRSEAEGPDGTWTQFMSMNMLRAN